MIVPSYTDERIFQELMDDWPAVKRKVKALGAELLASMPKSRIGLDEGMCWLARNSFRSKNGNNWAISAHCYEGSRDWWGVSYCEVENDRGTRSYYFLRGLRTKQPYYVEIIPHALRRMRERQLNLDYEKFLDDKPVEDILEMALFTPHDRGVFLAAGKVGRDGHFYAFTDLDGNTPGVVLAKNVMFYARRTPLGNYIFKTCIQPIAEPGSRKEEFMLMMFSLYRIANPRDFGKKESDRPMMIAALWKAFPTMHRHLDCLHERFVPMYP